MRPDPRLIGLAAFALAGVTSVLAATWAAGAIESISEAGVRRALDEAGHSWAAVETDGLQVTLSGTAPSEAQRFRALTAAGTVVDAARVIDAMEVVDPAAIQAPEFSIEILRNDEGISLIGLIPASTGREGIVETLTPLAANRAVTDMLETARHDVPEGWDEALAFGLEALRSLPRSKISITATRVSITAITDSAAEKARIEADLARKAPGSLRLALDISAPRPVIAPFTLRFLIDGAGARFDACSADTERARNRILDAAGATGRPQCTIGLGVPTPQWADAVVLAIDALKEMGAGSVTFSDADISLIAAETVSQEVYDRALGELESALPDVFSLHAVLTPKPEQEAADRGPPQFTAMLNEEGHVQLRGRLTDTRMRDAVESFARARFGINAVHAATRLDEELPDGWPVRVLAGLEALGELQSGTIVVQPEMVRISGVTGNSEAGSTIARILSDKLGEGAQYEIAVTYDEKLDPLLGLPTAEECVASINAALAGAKIAFEPGEATIAAGASGTLDRIAELLKDCDAFPMEVAGHTDSQGREEMNLSLSQDRAEAVITALASRRVLVGNLVAKGYGETAPIADNETEEGREANRRIEFTLIDLGEPEGEAGESAPAGDGTAGDETADPEAEVEVIVQPAEEATVTPLPRPDTIGPQQAGPDEGSGDGEDEEGAGD